MRIEHMRELIAIKKLGNYSKAAKSLFITQPALSRHIADMEKELGIKLLDRNKHNVELTEAGLKVYTQFQHIVQNYDLLLQDINGLKTGITGTLRLGMLYYTIKQDFSSIISKFFTQYPNVKFKKYYYQPHEVFSALKEDFIDIGILPGNITSGNIELSFQEFRRDGMEVMMSTEHPLAEKTALTLEDLAEEECIYLKDDPITNHSYEKALARCGFTASRKRFVEDLETVPIALQDNHAIYIKAKGFILPGYDREIVTRPIDSKCLYVPKAYAYRTNNSNPLITLFLSLAK